MIVFRVRLVVLSFLLCSLSACAQPGGRPIPDPHDPWEGFNRSMFSFNEGLDRALIKPLAKGYEAVTPTPLNTIITNFFNNIDDLMIGANNLLQGKVREAISDWGRVALNSSLGMGGLIDVATDMTFEKHDEDFGQTFARWGLGEGNYVVLPFFGPSTVRDSFGLAVDVPLSPLSWVNPDVVHYSMVGLKQIDARADLFPAEKLFDAGAIDRYSYLREAYLQRRQYLQYDGHPPRDEE
jgi:phospholipid-binding lipoprotein MlaA